jgi:hypothetical protein
MAEESTDLVREVRRIRFVLLALGFVLACIFAALAVRAWQEATRPPATSSQGVGELRSELQAVRNDLNNQRQPVPVVVSSGKPDPEARKWARSVGDGFLVAVGKSSGVWQTDPGVAAYLTPRYRAELSKQTSFISPRFERWSITSETLSPNDDDVILKGTFEVIRLIGKEPETTTRGFTLLVVKEKGQDKWRVDGFQD